MYINSTYSVQFDVNFMESKEPDFEEPKTQPSEAEITPPAMETPPPPISSSSSGVEDVPKSVESTSEPPPTTKPTEGMHVYVLDRVCFLKGFSREGKHLHAHAVPKCPPVWHHNDCVMPTSVAGGRGRGRSK